jgi:hypothetical protein
MGRWWLQAWTLTATLTLMGCATGPLQDNPILIRPAKVPEAPNPVYIPLGPPSYGKVFEKVLDVLDDYFEIAYANRYDGRIETFPRTAPGLGQPWKPGSPDFPQRLLASFQTIRHRAVVLIQAADDGGFFIDVKVLKELEDLPRPFRATAGAASFRSYNTVERQFEVIDSSIYEYSWIPIGRDLLLEQVILDRLAHMDLDCTRTTGEVNCPTPQFSNQPK